MKVLDIGANIGFYSVMLSKLVGNAGEVHAFEPAPRNFEFLVKNTAHLSNVVGHKLAVAGETGRIKLYLSEKLNVDHRTYDCGQDRLSTDVDAVSIDDFFRNGERFDFIKIDLQGYDYYAVSGMRETIKRSPGCMIIGEFYPSGLKKAGVEPRKYIELLEEIGLAVVFPGFDDIFAYESAFEDQGFYCDFFCVKR